jgi:hypothetical protein
VAQRVANCSHAALAVITLWPDAVLWLPRLSGYKG